MVYEWEWRGAVVVEEGMKVVKGRENTFSGWLSVVERSLEATRSVPRT